MKEPSEAGAIATIARLRAALAEALKAQISTDMISNPPPYSRFPDGETWEAGNLAKPEDTDGR
jgi:hypothetical protein